MKNDLSRFRDAHERDYLRALGEIRNGRKLSHWMWYIFPQLKGLGRSANSEYYGIRDLEEARAYLADPILGGHLITLCEALLTLETSDPAEVMGHPDDRKLRSSMTLFAEASDSLGIFRQVLEKYYQGKQDPRTLALLRRK